MWKRYEFIGGDERSLHHLLARRTQARGEFRVGSQSQLRRLHLRDSGEPVTDDYPGDLPYRFTEGTSK
jgi:hypothetical protein